MRPRVAWIGLAAMAAVLVSGGCQRNDEEKVPSANVISKMRDLATAATQLDDEAADNLKDHIDDRSLKLRDQAADVEARALELKTLIQAEHDRGVPAE